MATTITTWTSLFQQFLPLFTQPAGVIFTRLTIGWILCTVRRTVTGMLPFVDPQGQSDRVLCQPLGDRRYVQKHQAISRRSGAANIQGQRPRTGGRFESVAVFDGLAVVSEAKEQPTVFYCSSVEPAEVHAQLRRCDSLLATRTLV